MFQLAAKLQKLNDLRLALAQADSQLDNMVNAFKYRDQSDGDKNHDALLSRCYAAKKQYAEAHEAWFNAELLAA